MKADQEVTGFSKLRTITIGETEYPEDHFRPSDQTLGHEPRG